MCTEQQLEARLNRAVRTGRAREARALKRELRERTDDAAFEEWMLETRIEGRGR